MEYLLRGKFNFSINFPIITQIIHLSELFFNKNMKKSKRAIPYDTQQTMLFKNRNHKMIFFKYSKKKRQQK